MVKSNQRPMLKYWNIGVVDEWESVTMEYWN